jgi:glucose dehydrogenase
MERIEVPAEHFPDAREASHKEYDVVIIGAGISGGLIAYELVQAGKTVLMLEAGPDQTTSKDRNLFVENFYKAGQRTPESAYPEVPAAPKATTTALYERPYNGYLDQAGSGETNIPDNVANNWFKSTFERRVGGTTWHWLGTCLRLVPNDFKMRSVYNPDAPGFADWPIDYNDLAPWYDKAAIEMGVSGSADYLFGIPRHHDACPEQYKDYAPAKYPMPEILQSYSDDQVKQSVDGMKIDVDGLKGCLVVSPTPQARNSMPGYQQRPQCCGNSSCIPVCPIQAKYDATVHVNRCRNNYGKVFTLIAQASAHKLEVDGKGNISQVVIRKWRQDGAVIKYHDYTVKGKIVVVAAHAIESPKLLLNSRSKRAPEGVANSSGLVGKYLMDHNTQLSYAIVKDPVYSYRGPLSTSGIESLKDNSARNKMGAFRIEIGNDGWEWPDNAPYQTAYSLITGTGLKGNTVLAGGATPQSAKNGLFGQPLKKSLQETLIRQIRVAALVEPAPIRDHDVRVSDKLDALGLPRPKIRYGITDDPYCIKGMQTAIKVHNLIFKKLGAKDENIHHNTVENFAGAGHIMGTCRMGDDPKQSVVDKYQRSHDHKNLFIVGSSVFPTVGSSNPTFTIGALSLWAAETIKQQLSGKG